jgi:hypothetical protein
MAMRTARTPDARLINFADPALKFDGAAALRKLIASFVRGVKGERQNPVSEKQVVTWFKSTTPDFVRKQLTEAVGAGEVRIVRQSLTRRTNRAYRYEA